MNIPIIAAVLILLILPFTATAQSHTLLMDINPGEEDAFHNGNLSVVKWKDKVYFVALEGYIKRLWVTDGTTENTQSILDVGALGNRNPMVALEDQIILSGGSNENYGLITSDGTASGSNIYFPLLGVSFLFPIDSHHSIFIQNDLEVHYYVGITNGQTSGTMYEGEIIMEPSRMVTSRYDASIIVSGNSPEGPFCNVFITNGQPENTKCLDNFFEELYPGEIPSQIVGAAGDGSNIFFKTMFHGYYLFDGTSIQPLDISGSNPETFIKGVYVVGSRTLLHLSYSKLMVFNHQTNSLELLTYDIHDFAQPLLYDGHLYYPNSDGILSKTDGTIQSTEQLNTERMDGPAIYNPYLFTHDDKLYYSIWSDGRIMRSYDLTDNTDTFFDIIAHNDGTVSTSTIPTYMIPVGNKLMYLKRTAEYGTEWWVYDPLSVGIDSPESKTILCYPNPVKDVLMIEPGDADLSSSLITIYNTSGMIVMTGELHPGHMRVEVNDLVPGAYSLTIMNKANETLKTRFVKE